MFDHAQHGEPGFGDTMPVINPIDHESVAERLAGQVETDAMIIPVPSGLCVIPFELVILHFIRLTGSFAKFAEGCDGRDIAGISARRSTESRTHPARSSGLMPHA
jgi:hypothetical protein